MADTKISNLTTDSTPDRVADYVPDYDASAVATKKVLLSNLGVYVLPVVRWIGVSPADSTTYYLSPFDGALGTNAANLKTRIPRTGKVLAVYLDGLVTGTLASADNITVSFRLNDTTDTTISSTVTLNATPFSFSNTGLGISVSAGDYFNIKVATPAFATNPTSVYMQAMVYIA